MAWTLSAFSDEAGASAEAQIAAAQQAGLRWIDIRGIDGHNISALPLEEARDIRGKLDAAKIGVQMFGSPIGKIDIAEDFAPELEKLHHLAELASILGCRKVRIFSYYNAQNQSHEVWRYESLRRLSELKDLARLHDLTLYHENERHIFGDRSEDVEIIASQLRDQSTFQMIFDFDNFNQNGEDVWQAWQKLRDQTDSFHLKDSDANGQHVPVGYGRGRVREIIADAIERGWSGPVAIEPHLQHSAAIAATSPGGTANQQFAYLSDNECFQIACEEAQKLLRDCGVTKVL